MITLLLLLFLLFFLAFDPFFDISLDLSETKSATNDFDDFLSNENPNTLEACLSRFTSAEKLVNQDFRCSNCNSSVPLF
jgi:hypothetical protein